MPDFILPATACYLHGKLGISTSCLSFDINQTCAGYLYRLCTANSLIESRVTQKAPLIIGNTLSLHVNPLDSNLAPIICDGTSAKLLESSHFQNAKESKKMGFVSGFGQNDILDSIFMESSQDKHININKSAFFELGTQGINSTSSLSQMGRVAYPQKRLSQNLRCGRETTLGL